MLPWSPPLSTLSSSLSVQKISTFIHDIHAALDICYLPTDAARVHVIPSRPFRDLRQSAPVHPPIPHTYHQN